MSEGVTVQVCGHSLSNHIFIIVVLSFSLVPGPIKLPVFVT